MKENTWLTVVGAITSLAVVLVATTVVRGWVIAVLWGWFMVPIFALRGLGVLEAIGLSIMVGYFTQHLYSQQEQQQMHWSRLVGQYIGWTFFPLLLGWLVHELLLRGIGA